MKLFATLATVTLVALLTGCSNNKTTTAAPGAVNGSKSECSEAGKTGCSKECSTTDAAKAAPGAVSGSGCCKDGAAKTCPATSATAAPGAVSGKSGCCSEKSGCTAK